jgi:uncharacterized protein YbgA (DUF1722 family)/uncharacterized protein YbbK (DUF523 family)
MKIGISACLLGELCRYDGASSKDLYIFSLMKYFTFVPYCPEAAIFGTPRETIRLVEMDGVIKVFTNQTHKDVTQELEGISKRYVVSMENEDLCGFILKSKSPSCGMERVKVYQEKNPFNEKKGVGIFAKNIKEAYPYLPIEEEGRLNDPWLKENFLMQVFAYGDLQTFLDSKPSFKHLVKFHTSYKYLIYSKSQKSYKRLGLIVANMEKLPLEEVLEIYKKHFLEAIAEKGNIKKTSNILLHIFGYFKKHISKEEKKYILEALEEYKNEIIPLIAVIKLLNLYTNTLNIEYLKEQKFLNPYPKELALRSDIKAYK